MASSSPTSSDDDWEEVAMVLEIRGAMDNISTQDAISAHRCAVRHANSDAPLVQISGTLFTSQWEFASGSDLILRTDGQQLHPIGASDIRLVAEKALISPDE